MYLTTLNMKKITVIVLLFFSMLSPLLGQNTSLYKIHSHNDYEQIVPFWQAVASKSASIEADVILTNGQLMVAHEKETIRPNRTLTSLYLNPMMKAKEMGLLENYSFQLLVDVKTEPYATLKQIVKEVSDPAYTKLWFGKSNPNGIRLVITGGRPKASEYKNYPEYIQFDYQEKDFSTQLPLDKIALFSYSFSNFSVWNGKGRIVEEEEKALKNIIDQVHKLGKPIRFWGSPDGKTAWKAFADLGVDFINTDQPYESTKYLSKLPYNIYKAERQYDVYQPTYQSDAKDMPIDGVILMIGDGNGLAQISAAMFANGNKLNMAQIKSLGLVKTQAADDFTTDSAAGGTAMATGQKANNRAIGIGPNEEKLQNFPELLKGYGFKTGIVTTDHISGATPAAFFAHQIERDDVDAIAADLQNSPLNLFVGGGRQDFVAKNYNRLDSLKAQGFDLAESLSEIATSKSTKLGYFASVRDIPSVSQGRGNFLQMATNNALRFLNDGKAPFFLMVEGAKIDVGGHNNSTRTIVEEGIDFDRAVGEVMKYVDEHPNTLLVVTADHETGGVALPQGNVAEGIVELDYISNDHTGMMVPLFAYGAHSNAFQGVYENTEVFQKILSLIKKYHNPH